MSSFFIEQLALGPMDNFVYLIGDKAEKKLAVVDPAWESQSILNEVAKSGCDLTAILLTHGHFDHTNALEDVCNGREIPIYLSQHESLSLTPEIPHLIRTTDGQSITLGGATLSVLHTPGHTPGGQCFLFGNHLISGDTLFVDGCGRADLEGSDPEALWESLQRLKQLPAETVIYPGHHYGNTPTDTMGSQILNNRFLRCANRDQFLRLRMGR